MIISVRTNVAEFNRVLTDFQRRQIPFAAMKALNETATKAAQQITADLPSIFDRPTPFTMRAVKVLYADKSTLRAVVTAQPIQAQFLALQETGGVRTGAMNTRKSARALLEPQGIKLNQYGNIANGAFARLLSGNAAVVEQRKANVAARKAAPKGQKRAAAKGVYRGTIYIKGGTPQAHGKPGGLFRLTKGKLFRLTGFAAQAHYQARFGFHGRVGAVVRKVFNGAMARQLAAAIRTAR